MAIELEGKVVCITGALSSMTRAQATEQLEALGATVSKSVTKKTDILFCGARAGMKLEKAEEYGIPIYHEAEFDQLVGDEAAVARASERAAAPEAAAALQEIEDGETVEVQGSAAKPYELKNVGGVYSCTCPAWRNQSVPIDLRSCKHLSMVRGAAAEEARVGRKVSSVKSKKTSAPKVLLAQKWEPHVDPTGWWMSEKLDGVRAIWTGESFVSRQGNPFFAPDWFVEGFPSHPLDGELWLDRGKFQKTVSVVRRQDKSDHWKDIRFVMFDAPDQGGTFEERIAYMEETFADSLGFASVLAHAECEGFEHLADELARIEGLGGEGVMLRQPGSSYVRSRSHTLLKVKTFHDAEAVVVGCKGGQGRHRSRVGALELMNEAGVTFFAGTGLSDAERESPPAIGTLVTYRFQELTDAGVPRFPTYVGVRIDGAWKGPPLSDMTRAKGEKSLAAIAKKESAAGEKDATKNARGKTRTTASAAKKSEGSQVGDDEPAANADAEAGDTRRFEYVSGSSSKFWQITCVGNSHTVRYGRIGTKGTCKEKSFENSAAAKKDAARLIRQKQGKGYEEVV